MSAWWWRARDGSPVNDLIRESSDSPAEVVCSAVTFLDGSAAWWPRMERGHSCHSLSAAMVAAEHWLVVHYEGDSK